MTQKVTITFSEPGSDCVGHSIDVAVGTSILDAASDAGVEIEATCGRRGKCRSCRVKVLSGDIPPATVQDTIQLGHDAVTERFRLACQTSAIADCVIMAAPPQIRDRPPNTHRQRPHRACREDIGFGCR